MPDASIHLTSRSVQPGERIEIIKRIATQLAARGDWDEIDLVLEQFGFPTMWSGKGTRDPT